MNKFLKEKTDSMGNDMMPRRGNSGKNIRENFTRDERLGALGEFYKKNENKHPEASRDFFKQHPDLDK